MVSTELKASLLAQLSELETRLEAVTRDLTGQHSSDSAEQAQERENDEVLAAIQRESETEIREIRQALIRLDNNEYGICRTCSAEISAGRLKALPYATQCITCAGQTH
ncbi:MAG: TraR/DksA C4-type zinc finger protein [Hahellaceae bacterium]|jgi:DnaK suppressor protein|nr:TraR/DksA C4-type zinc finger protein [Hahellaceae bacterium]